MKNSHKAYSSTSPYTSVLVIGSGIAGLTAACMLARDGFEVTVLERNWLPGGCSSAYPRKGYIFESGATTLLGLSEGMPLHALFAQLGLKVPALKLDLPMQVHLPNGQQLKRYAGLEEWIGEAERVFGAKNQRQFWTRCYEVSQLVWKTALQQMAFPPSSWKDLLHSLRSICPHHLKMLPLAFRSMEAVLKTYQLHQHEQFRTFLNEQLLITAQNYLSEVNFLFGATALCYTLYPNYYLPGGMIELIKPMVHYIEQRGGRVLLRMPVEKVRRIGQGYEISTHYRKQRTQFYAQRLVSAIPLNNTLALFDSSKLERTYRKRLMHSPQLYSAFQAGLVFRRRKHFGCLHHQLLLPAPLPQIGARSFFLSLSHPHDTLRCKASEVVASVSAHIPDPAHTPVSDKEQLLRIIEQSLIEKGFFERGDLLYAHTSTARSWEKWTGRQWGFVGGYPQYRHIKPWQMVDARFDGAGAYICGDTTYPGQGIAGACLSGMIAVQKMKLDGMADVRRAKGAKKPEEIFRQKAEKSYL